MGRRNLLSAEERRHLFGVPVDRDALARLYTFGPRDLSLIEARREVRNRLGFAVSDYGRYHLRRPPRGYSWYRAGDDFVLAALGSGLIFEVIDAEGY